MVGSSQTLYLSTRMPSSASFVSFTRMSVSFSCSRPVPTQRNRVLSHSTSTANTYLHRKQSKLAKGIHKHGSGHAEIPSRITHSRHMTRLFHAVYMAMRERTECGELLGEAEVDVERDDQQRRAGERRDAHEEVQLQQRRHHLRGTATAARQREF